MVVASNTTAGFRPKCGFYEVPHILPQGPGIRPAEAVFQFLPTLFLVRGHSPLPAQFAVAKVDEEFGALFNRDVMMKREVLTELERFEPVNDYVGWRAAAIQHIRVKEKAMSAEPTKMPVNRLGRDVYIPSDLSVCHPADRLHEEGRVEVGELLPIGSAERLAAERTPTVKTRKPLDTLRVLVSVKEPRPLVVPICR